MSNYFCDPIGCSTPGSPVLHYPPEFAPTHAHWVGDTISSSHPLPLFSSLPSIFPNIRIFSNESALPIRWSKYWSFSFSLSLSNEYSGLSFFRIDWFDLLVFEGTLKSLLQHHSLKASILWCSAFFMVQLSHPYMTTGALTIKRFINNVMFLLFNILSRFYHSFSSKEQLSS